MPDWLTSVPAWASFGGGAGAGFFIFKWLLEWLAGRMDKQNDRTDAGTQRLIDRLEKRLDDVTARLEKAEADLDDCKRRHAESEAEVMRLKAMLQGMGDARQTQQLRLAARGKE